MNGPLTQVLQLSFATEMILAVLVGMGFGFALERAGFGRSDNLAAIFYGRDFRVLRVMFTAIVTAMVGLYLLDLAGALPISSIGVLDTYLGGQLVGGLLVGFGFIVGGWCPGTSIVGVVSGKIDALLFMGGLVAGSALFALGFDSLRPVQDSGARGRVLLHAYLHVPSGVMVFAVALFAVGCFWAVGRIERAVKASVEERAVGPDAQPISDGPSCLPAAADGRLS